MRGFRFAAVSGAGALLLAGAAFSQAEDDWDLVRSQDGRTTEASMAFSSGLSLAVRCEAGGMQAAIEGLPRASGAVRTISLVGGGQSASPGSWVNGAGGRVLADYPAAFARRVRSGGPVRMMVESGGRRTAYELALPARSRALEAVLGACGQPLTDARDADLPLIGGDGVSANVFWSRRPVAEHPEGDTWANGNATASCLVQPSGQLTNCRVEGEAPGDGNFGKATLEAAQLARATPRARGASATVAAFRLIYRL